MPKTKLDRPRYPPINNLRAAILERKFVADLNWGDLAAVAGISESKMTRLAKSKPPEEWPQNIRNAVCRLLDIRVTVTVTGE